MDVGAEEPAAGQVHDQVAAELVGRGAVHLEAEAAGGVRVLLGAAAAAAAAGAGAGGAAFVVGGGGAALVGGVWGRLLVVEEEEREEGHAQAEAWGELLNAEMGLRPQRAARGVLAVHTLLMMITIHSGEKEQNRAPGDRPTERKGAL